jgi:hypothetical protein
MAADPKALLAWALPYLIGYDHHVGERAFEEQLERIRAVCGMEREHPRWKIDDVPEYEPTANEASPDEIRAVIFEHYGLKDNGAVVGWSKLVRALKSKFHIERRA